MQREDNKETHFTSIIPNPHWLGWAMHDLLWFTESSKSGFNPSLIRQFSVDLLRIKTLSGEQLRQGLENGILYEGSSEHSDGVWGRPLGKIAPGTEIINVQDATKDEILTFGRNCLIYCIAVTAAEHEYDTQEKAQQLKDAVYNLDDSLIERFLAINHTQGKSFHGGYYSESRFGAGEGILHCTESTFWDQRAVDEKFRGMQIFSASFEQNDQVQYSEPEKPEFEHDRGVGASFKCSLGANKKTIVIKRALKVAPGDYTNPSFLSASDSAQFPDIGMPGSIISAHEFSETITLLGDDSDTGIAVEVISTQLPYNLYGFSAFASGTLGFYQAVSLPNYAEANQYIIDKLQVLGRKLGQKQWEALLNKIHVSSENELHILFDTVRGQIENEQSFTMLGITSAKSDGGLINQYLNSEGLGNLTTARNSLQRLLSGHLSSDAREKVMLLCQMAKFYHWCENEGYDQDSVRYAFTQLIEQDLPNLADIKTHITDESWVQSEFFLLEQLGNLGVRVAEYNNAVLGPLKNSVFSIVAEAQAKGITVSELLRAKQLKRRNVSWAKLVMMVPVVAVAIVAQVYSSAVLAVVGMGLLGAYLIGSCLKSAKIFGHKLGYRIGKVITGAAVLAASPLLWMKSVLLLTHPALFISFMVLSAGGIAESLFSMRKSLSSAPRPNYFERGDGYFRVPQDHGPAHGEEKNSSAHGGQGLNMVEMTPGEKR